MKEEKPKIKRYAVMFSVTKVLAETVESENPLDAEKLALMIVKEKYPDYDVEVLQKRNLTDRELYKVVNEVE